MKSPRTMDDESIADSDLIELRLDSEEAWINEIADRLGDRKLKPLEAAVHAVQLYPTDGRLLMLACFAAVVEERPNVSLRYIKRFTKWYEPDWRSWACQAIALAQAGRWPVAQTIVKKHRLHQVPASFLYPPGIDARWAGSLLRRIRRWKPQEIVKRKAKAKTQSSSVSIAERERARQKDRRAREAKRAVSDTLPHLPRIMPRVSLSLKLPGSDQFAMLGQGDGGSADDFLLRHDFVRISLLKGFDELLCIPQLQGIHHYQYQIETARKVLKQFRGRVLLADEVGLGKTIEAGMVLKEYLLRGMVERVLILTPASLVGQWQEEMGTKFGLDFVTTHEPLIRRDPKSFWSAGRIIASIATARMRRHMEVLVRQRFDLVIVDEAHHLKNRTSKNWKLVNALKTRFLLLLSATPVQNNLVELYNLLTLLKPGLFKTEREFRGSYMKPGKPRVPLNSERLRHLMRDVMIRNTRALVNVKLPPRQALTLRVVPTPGEADCYRELNQLIRALRAEGVTRHRLALHHMLEAAGSSPAAAAAALHRFARNNYSRAWQDLRDRYAAVGEGAKVQALFEVLNRNPNEKKIIFVRLTETLRYLDEIFRERGLSFARFDGQMSGPRKDEAVYRFRDEVPILLCTESGGEGRNMQFCHTLINFDLPWNPQTIEQRIGRIHRIGQEHEVFIFNLATRGTVEEKILTILDEKISMFELVVGEVQAILGEMEENVDFAEMIFQAWTEKSEDRSDEAFDALGNKLLTARRQYEETKTYDDELFGEDFEAV